MGVSKQAAQKRFVPAKAGTVEIDMEAGFDRFTPRAANVVVAAHNEARPAPPTTRSSPPTWSWGC